MKTSTSVQRLWFSKDAFEIIARANYLLSIRNQRQEVMQQVLREGLRKHVEFSPNDALSFWGLSPFDGDTQLYLRVNESEQVGLEKLRSQISAATGQACQQRDAVLYVCWLATQDRYLTA